MYLYSKCKLKIWLLDIGKRIWNLFKVHVKSSLRGVFIFRYDYDKILILRSENVILK